MDEGKGKKWTKKRRGWMKERERKGLKSEERRMVIRKRGGQKGVEGERERGKVIGMTQVI